MRALATVLCLSLLPLPAAATIIQVPADQPTVQAGLDAAAAGDEVVVACGTYLEFDIVMKSGVTLRGATGEWDCVVIDAQQLGRVMVGQNLNADTRIEGITFTGGTVDDELLYGGGAFFENSALALEHCRFTGNYADYRGGGIGFHYSPATVTHCLFDANEGDHGGGGGLDAYYSEITVSDCRFEGNAGIDGGAMVFTRCDPLIERCVMLNNSGQFWGGAVMCHSTTSPLLRDCTLVGNHAYVGSGLWAVHDSHPRMENCIVAFNTGGGGGLVLEPSGSHPSTLTLSCSNVFNNESGNYGGDLDDQTGLNGNFSAHPLFCDLAAGDLTLSTDSPCLPAGNECGVLIGALGEGCAHPTDSPTSAAAGVLLRQNRPNPFNPATEIVFSLPTPTRVSLNVYDLGGQRVATLLRGASLPAGESVQRWNGRDDAGRPLATGVYLYRLEGPTWTLSRKMTLLK